mmetsp:Transcript_30513/g.60385  ORF Transcript_30513/g.60385 Transcript_30513/m.60385 type:complete len:382 (+) Transcript_30513:334-1479(+)
MEEEASKQTVDNSLHSQHIACADGDRDVNRETDGQNADISSLSPGVACANAGLFVLSGCSQPLLMTLIKNAGFADPSAQLYMVFYYIAPALVIFSLLSEHEVWPSKKTILQACGIAVWDIVATSMNYTGASLAGPTIFSIVYSSVTVWTAIFSRVFLGRSMNVWQWLGVVIVFGGLLVTSTDSLNLGEEVVNGLMLVIFGSAAHSMSYVMSEGIMTKKDQRLSIPQNCAVQGLVALLFFTVWQLVYTVPRFDELVREPMQKAGTSVLYGAQILFLFTLANFIHSITFYVILKDFLGGSTSAGVMKGLQAVLVFVFTDRVYCGRIGGPEMCFTESKLMSLIIVVGGVILFGVATQRKQQRDFPREGDGYTMVERRTEDSTLL